MSSLLKNSIYNILYRMINIIYPLVTITYVSRVLKPEGIGKVSLVQSIVIFCVAISLLGIPNYGIRELSKLKGKELDTTFTELFMINFISTLIMSLTYFSIINYFSFIVDKSIYNIYGIIILLNIINIDWFYQAKEDFRYITLRTAIIKIFSTILIFSFVKEENDIYIYNFIFSLSYVANYIINAWNLRNYIRFNFENINLIKHLYSIFVLGIASISNEIYVTFDNILLGILSSNSEVAFYSNSMKLTRILVNLLSAISVVMLPRLSMLYNNKNYSELNKIINEVIKILLWLSIPMCIGLLFLSEYIVLFLFGSDFLLSAKSLKILSFLIILKTISSFSLQILVSAKKDFELSRIYFKGMIINMLLNIILVSKFSSIGSAVSSIISELYICTILFYYSRKHFELKLSKFFIISLFFYSGIMLLFLVITDRYITIFQPSLFLKLIINIFIGFNIYIIISIITKNSVIDIIYSKIKKEI